MFLGCSQDREPALFYPEFYPERDLIGCRLLARLRTCRQVLRMSVYRGRPEVVGPLSKQR